MKDINNPTVDEVVDLWCTALESGKYKQGKRNLCNLEADSPTYCCLGVLVEEYHNFFEIQVVERGGHKIYEEGYYNVLPPSVKKWAKINDSGGHYSEGSLWSDNDIKDKSFTEIAQIIRDNKDTIFAKD